MTRNKVPSARSHAAPGCWECAGCGLILSNDENYCRRCEGTDNVELPDDSKEHTEQATIAEVRSDG